MESLIDFFLLLGQILPDVAGQCFDLLRVTLGKGFPNLLLVLIEE